jgi:two-component system NarL family sensor kinase
MGTAGGGDDSARRHAVPGRRVRARRSVVFEVGQFALAGAAALVLVGYATSVAARRVGEREAIADVRTTTVIRAQGVVTPVLDDALTAGDAEAIARLDAVVRSAVLDADLVRVKLWTADGTIVYSDEAQLIGSRYELGDDELAAMATGRIEAEVSDVSKPENRFERDFDKLLEVYLPVRTPGADVLLFEAYHRYELVSENGDRLWRSFAPISIGALVMLEVVQLPLALSLARRLRQRRREREGLLRRTLEASDVERRQIASDLHDGVVQDLAGVAFGLSAARRRAPDAAADARLMDESADIVRSSIRALRSLVVDIYPPDFDQVTLESALTDLAGRVSEGGIDVTVDFSGLADPVPDAVARLLYRAAQEGVRNVLAHAGATTVRVAAATSGPTAVLEVTDDGRGVGDEVLAGRVGEGHLGLRALQGLVNDAGGAVDLTSAPGRGTTLRVEVPLP